MLALPMIEILCGRGMSIKISWQKCPGKYFLTGSFKTPPTPFQESDPF